MSIRDYARKREMTLYQAFYQAFTEVNPSESPLRVAGDVAIFKHGGDPPDYVKTFVAYYERTRTEHLV